MSNKKIQIDATTTFYETLAQIKQFNPRCFKLAYVSETNTLYVARPNDPVEYVPDDTSVIAIDNVTNWVWVGLHGTYAQSSFTPISVKVPFVMTKIALQATISVEPTIAYCAETKAFYQYITNGASFTIDNNMIIGVDGVGSEDARWVSLNYVYNALTILTNLTVSTINNRAIGSAADNILVVESDGKINSSVIPDDIIPDWDNIANKPLTFKPSNHTHNIGDLPVALSGVSSATNLVRADDSRLNNSRTPVAHTHNGSDIITEVATATNVTNKGAYGNQIYDFEVVKYMRWKNFGNNHIVIDLSNGTTPTGATKNNTDPDVAWQPSYPTLMGWNGSNTFGVRVDSARYANGILFTIE